MKPGRPSPLRDLVTVIIAIVPAVALSAQPPATDPPASPAPSTSSSGPAETVTVKFNYLLASARAALSQRAFSDRTTITLRDTSPKPQASPGSPAASLLDRAAILAASSITLRYQPQTTNPADGALIPAKLRLDAGRISAWATRQSLTILAEDIPAAIVQATWAEPFATPVQSLHAQDQLPRAPLPQLSILFDDESAWLTSSVPAAGKLTWPAQVTLMLDRPDAPIIVQGSGPHGPATAEFDQRSSRLIRLSVSLPQQRTLDVQITQIPHQPSELTPPDPKDRQVLPSFTALVAFKPPAKPIEPATPANTLTPPTITPPANADAPSHTRP